MALPSVTLISFQPGKLLITWCFLSTFNIHCYRHPQSDCIVLAAVDDNITTNEVLNVTDLSWLSVPCDGLVNVVPICKKDQPSTASSLHNVLSEDLGKA